MLAASATAAFAKDIRLIAHRGGVVDSSRPENSPGAVAEAIARGYWMIEVDVRSTRDGEPVLHHDNTLAKYYGEPKRVEELTWAEVRKLKSNPGGTPPLHFEELCAMCSGKMRLMLDLKGQWESPFYARLLRIIMDASVPNPIWSLGGPRVRPYFEDQVMVSVDRKTLRDAAAAGEPVAEQYFLFELASELDREGVRLARSYNVDPVAAVNTFRYAISKRDDWAGPKEDIAKLLPLGVRHYQVDSRYEPLFSN